MIYLYEKESRYFIEGLVHNKTMKNSDDILSWIQTDVG